MDNFMGDKNSDRKYNKGDNHYNLCWHRLRKLYFVNSGRQGIPNKRKLNFDLEYFFIFLWLDHQ